MDHVAALAVALMRAFMVAIALIVALVITLFLSGFAPRFVLGAETPAPQGCIEARTRGHEC